MTQRLLKALLVTAAGVMLSANTASATPDVALDPCQIMLKAVDTSTAALKPFRQRIAVDGWSYDDPGMEYIADNVWKQVRLARLHVALIPDNDFPQWWTNLAHRYESRASQLIETIRIRAMPDLDREDINFYLQNYDDVATDVVGTCTNSTRPEYH